MGREFLCGAVLGEWGADDHDNIYYLGGWVASGVIVIGDLRDIAATISRGDLVGTGLNLAALIPGYGDAAKVAAVVGKFVLKHPELVKPAVLLLAGVTRYSDETTEALSILKYSYGDEIGDLIVDGPGGTPLNPEIADGKKTPECGGPPPLTPPPPSPAGALSPEPPPAAASGARRRRSLRRQGPRPTERPRDTSRSPSG
jgi:hypothetical protein